MRIQDITRDIIATAQRPLDQACTLPREAYTDETYFAHEAEQVLRAGWLCIAHVSQISAPGAVLPIDILDEPIMLVRGNDDVIRALSRVCPHRSSDMLIDGEKSDCRTSGTVLTCPYHRWTFGLDGKLLGAPYMQEAAGFNKSEWKLAEIRCAVWEGFVFVNLDNAAPPLDAYYADFTSTVAPWKLGDLELVISMDWECNFNWKVMVENWIESYHHLGPHSKTLNPFMPAQDTWSEPPNPAFIHAHLPMTGRDAAPMREAIEKGQTGAVFCLYRTFRWHVRRSGVCSSGSPVSCCCWHGTAPSGTGCSRYRLSVANSPPPRSSRVKVCWRRTTPQPWKRRLKCSGIFTWKT